MLCGRHRRGLSGKPGISGRVFRARLGRVVTAFSQAARFRHHDQKREIFCWSTRQIMIYTDLRRHGNPPVFNEWIKTRNDENNNLL